MLVVTLVLITASFAVCGCAARPETPQQAADRAKSGQDNGAMGGSGGNGGGGGY